MRVLVVERDAATARWVRDAFARAGDDVTSVDPVETPRWSRGADRYDVIVIACEPPECDAAVAHDVQDDLRGRPIVVVSERARDEDVARALDTGAADVVAGPPSPAVLRARVYAAVRRAGPASGALLTRGDLTVDRATARVRGPAGDVALTAKEYTLLEYLMRHAGQVIARARLLEEVWGFRFDPGTNVAEVALSRLRQKLADVGSRATVRTVRRLGVVLELAPDDVHPTER